VKKYFFILASFIVLSCTHIRPIHGDNHYSSSSRFNNQNRDTQSQVQRINKIVKTPITRTHDTYEIHNTIKQPELESLQTQVIQPYESNITQTEDLTVNINDEFEETDNFNVALTAPINKKIDQNLDIVNQQLSNSDSTNIAATHDSSRAITAEFIEQNPNISQNHESFQDNNLSQELISDAGSITTSPIDSHLNTESEIINEDYETMTYDANFITDFNENTKNKWVKYFSVKDKARFERFISNGSAYKNFIMETLEKQGVPKEIFYVGLIESGYYLKAKSHASAVGPWQFIKGVGQEYGLRVNSYVDERKDIEKSTKAAAVLFNDLYNIFGSWELALSAYNAGPYRMIGLIRRHNTREYSVLTTKSNFPKETAEYVPKVAAVMEILNKPELYDINIRPKQDYKSNTKLIPLRYSQSLDSIARKLNLSTKELMKFNPEIIGKHTPFRKKSKYMLRVPLQTYYDHGSQIAALENFKGSNPYRKSYKNKIAKTKAKYHKVKSGQTLSQIAMQYKTSSSRLIKLNKFKNAKIFAGQNLKVPHSKSAKKLIHKVRRGENLSIIAKKFRTSVAKLVKANSIKKGKIYPGQKLIIRK